MSNRWKAGYIQYFFDPLTEGEFAPNELYVWGQNDFSGGLGLGDKINRSSPVQLGSGDTWLSITAGQYNGGGIKSDNTMYVWGEISNGLSGNSNAIDQSSPVQVGTDSDWSVFDIGQQTGGGIKTNGTLWTWGSDSNGKQAQNAGGNTSSPVQVGALTSWAKVNMGGFSAAYITTSGELYMAGKNVQGQLGINDSGATSRRSSPVQVGSETWTKVDNTENFTLGLRTNGTLWAWGQNSNGQLGQDDRIDRSSPVQIGSETNWTDLAVGRDAAAAAINSSGELYSWGENEAGILGQNIPTTTKRSSPVQIGALTNWSKVFGGYTRMFAAIKTDGTLWVWGNDTYGQSGQNATTLGRSSPIQVGSSTSWSDAAVGRFNVLGLED